MSPAARTSSSPAPRSSSPAPPRRTTARSKPPPSRSAATASRRQCEPLNTALVLERAVLDDGTHPFFARERHEQQQHEQSDTTRAGRRGFDNRVGGLVGFRA